jgi:pyrimidine-specific ribonucleoside hydrolase
VAGNSGLEQVLVNTAKVLDAAQASDVPIAGGAARPLLERRRREGQFHGVDGLGGIELPDPRRPFTAHGGVEMLRAAIQASPEPVTLVALAPQTNIALLLSLYPEVAERLDRIIFMGGSANGGNVTAVAEFNVWQDPEAAACVVGSGVPTTMYGLDVFSRLTVSRKAADSFREHHHPAQQLAGQLLERRGARSVGPSPEYRGLIGDAGALVMMTNPELFGVRRCPVRVELAGSSRGQTVVDRRPSPQDAEARARDPWPELDVALELDGARAAAAFVQTIRRYR